MKIWKDRLLNFWKYKDLMAQLVSRDIKLKYRRSFLGYLWSILNPLFIMIIMTIIFSTMFSYNITNFPVYLFTGRMLFEFTSISTKQAMKSIIDNAALIKKAYVPKYIFTLSKITSCVVDLVFSFGALLLVILFTHSKITWHFILSPLVIIQIYIFCCGLGFLLATYNVFFRDIEYIYNAVITAWMYLTPIFYPIERLPETVRFGIEWFNPLYYYVAQFRALIYQGQMPEFRVVYGGLLFAIIVFAIGLWAFIHKQDKFILHI